MKVLWPVVGLCGCCEDHHNGPDGQVMGKTWYPVLQTVLAKKTGENKTTGVGDKEFRSTKLCEMPK